MRGALVVALGLAMVTGCKKSEQAAPASTRPPELAPAEVSRGKAACDDLVARLCACAAAHPDNADLADKCHMKAAKPEALALALEVTMDPKASDDTVARAQMSIRTIVGKCIEEIAALPTLGCK